MPKVRVGSSGGWNVDVDDLFSSAAVEKTIRHFADYKPKSADPPPSGRPDEAVSKEE